MQRYKLLALELRIASVTVFVHVKITGKRRLTVNRAKDKEVSQRYQKPNLVQSATYLGTALSGIIDKTL